MDDEEIAVYHAKLNGIDLVYNQPPPSSPMSPLVPFRRHLDRKVEALSKPPPDLTQRSPVLESMRSPNWSDDDSDDSRRRDELR